MIAADPLFLLKNVRSYCVVDLVHGIDHPANWAN